MPEPTMHITDLLAEAVERHASDLHVAAGLPPLLRVHGSLVRAGESDLDGDGVMALLRPLMNAQQLHTLAHQREVDFAHEQPGLARFRVNAFHQRRGPSAAIRVVPAQIPTLDSLQAPSELRELALLQRGLVLFTGPTGSGKSTSMAALVAHRNRHEYGHILTLEDPIEFVHESQRSLVNQREVGTHTLGYAQALRSALREDPDVIL
ncbi:MAG: type IV pilus twitching motility protein PilT, partial [Betaproteobacteria bacterium]